MLIRSHERARADVRATSSSSGFSLLNLSALSATSYSGKMAVGLYLLARRGMLTSRPTGPGRSSLEGLLQENGPFTWPFGQAAPTVNEYGQTNISSPL
jgi:hypothetical protein